MFYIFWYPLTIAICLQPTSSSPVNHSFSGWKRIHSIRFCLLFLLLNAWKRDFLSQECVYLSILELFSCIIAITSSFVSNVMILPSCYFICTAVKNVLLTATCRVVSTVENAKHAFLLSKSKDQIIVILIFLLLLMSSKLVFVFPASTDELRACFYRSCFLTIRSLLLYSPFCWLARGLLLLSSKHLSSCFFFQSTCYCKDCYF